MNKKFVTMGEIMVRMTRPGYERLMQGSTFEDYFGGSEANVAVSLATMGDEVDFVTRLPNSLMGVTCRNELRKYNVGTRNIVWGGDRMGLYYVERAVSLRGSKLVYDRAGSSMATLEPNQIDWKNILKDASIFHWSGISCALSESAANATLEGLEEARKCGIYTSLDINYRKNLWKYGRDARDVLLPAAKKCHVIFGDTGEWQLITGKTLPPFEAKDTCYEMDIEGYKKFFVEAKDMFPDSLCLVMAVRNQISATHHLLTGLLYTGGKLYHTSIVDINPVLDPMGVGDAFIAAFLHAFFKWENESQKQLNFALTASAMKNTIMGDFNLVSEDEVLDCMEDIIEMV